MSYLFMINTIERRMIISSKVNAAVPRASTLNTFSLPDFPPSSIQACFNASVVTIVGRFRMWFLVSFLKLGSAIPGKGELGVHLEIEWVV